MPISAEHIRSTISRYCDDRPESWSELAIARVLLNGGADLTSRKEFRGHATAAVVLVNEDGHVLHIHHLALDRWLLPGGHLEPQDDTLQEAARRELYEETGIYADLITPVGVGPVHIDVHENPASAAKGEPAHCHFDFRFLYRTTIRDDLSLQEDEVGGYVWRPVGELENPELGRRITEALAAV